MSAPGSATAQRCSAGELFLHFFLARNFVITSMSPRAKWCSFAGLSFLPPSNNSTSTLIFPPQYRVFSWYVSAFTFLSSVTCSNDAVICDWPGVCEALAGALDTAPLDDIQFLTYSDMLVILQYLILMTSSGPHCWLLEGFSDWLQILELELSSAWDGMAMMPGLAMHKVRIFSFVISDTIPPPPGPMITTFITPR